MPILNVEKMKVYGFPMNKKKVLLIDDQPDITAIIEEFLATNYDIETKTINSSIMAKDILLESNYNLVISDHHMPELTGVELLRFIRDNDGPNQETPFIFLTAMQPEVKKELGLDFKNVIVLNKVDKIQLIISTIEKFII